MFKKGAIFINTSRGGIVDTEALIYALDKKILGGIGLDVLEEECIIKEEKQLLSPSFKAECNLKTVLEEHMLLKYPNVLITPHNAFNSTEALTRILDVTCENIHSYIKGKPMNVISS